VGGSTAKRWLKLVTFGCILLDVKMDAEGKILIILNPEDKKYAHSQAKKLTLWKGKPLKLQALIPVGKGERKKGEVLPNYCPDY